MARRKFWGWGVEGAGPTQEQARGHRAHPRRALRRRPRAGARRRASRRSRCARRACGRRRPRRALHRRPRRARRPHLRQVVPRRRARLPPRVPEPARPRRAAPRARPTSPRSSTGAARRASRRSRTAAARAWSAASSPTSATATRRASASTSGGSIACSRSTAPRAPRASRPASSAPRSRTQLRPHGLTLRHFPQSFEFSTLGGWIATRSGGHYATLYTHIDDFVESLRVVTPTGVARDAAPARLGRRARAGPPVPRLRGHARHHHRGVDAPPGPPAPARRRVGALRGGDDGFRARRAAVRALSQSGLHPTQLPAPRPGRGAHRGRRRRRRRACSCSASSPPTTPSTPGWRAPSSAARDAGGDAARGRRSRTRRDDGGAARRRRRRLAHARSSQAPYLRDVLVSLGVIAETFETAVTWDRFEAFHAGVMEARPRRAEARLRRRLRSPAASPTSTPTAPRPTTPCSRRARRGSELAQWAEIKAAASDAILALGGTITHHHAVGRDHRPWYDRERPELFARALAPRSARSTPPAS